MSRGHDRERQVRRRLEADGWWTCRAAGSLGDADVVALRKSAAGSTVAWLVEVKANRNGGAYSNFRPDDRRALAEAAERVGAIAMLAFWPPRAPLHFIPSTEWPS